VVGDPTVKRKIRIAAEAEEKEFYEHRAPKPWEALRSSRHRLAQAVPGNRAVADRGICATVSNFSGWNTLTDILLD